MILDFGILGRSRGCTTRQFGDGAWRSEARIPPGLPLGATSKPTVSNRVGARKQIEHFFRGQNPTKSQKNPDFQPRGQNFTKSQKNPDFQPRGQNPTKSQKQPRLPTQRSELYKITEKPRLQSLSSYTVYTFRFDTCFVHPPVTKTPISKSKSLTTDSCSLRDFCPRNSLNLTLQENKKIQLPFVVWKWEFSKNLIEAVVVCEKSSDSDSFILRNCNFIAMNFLAQINVDYPGRRPQAPACFK